MTSKQVSRALVAYLKKTNRLGLLSQVLREAQKESPAYIDPNLAVIETVITLSETQLKELQQQLSEKVGRELQVKNMINPDLIGGMRIRLGDVVIDQSLAHHIDQLAYQVLE